MKISRRSSLLLAAMVAALSFGFLQTARAGFQQQTATVTGTLLGFDEEDGILTIETRTTRLDLLLTNSTEIFVNGRSAAVNALQVDDRVTVMYETFTYRATRVEVNRQRKRSGKIVSVNGNNIVLKQKSGERVTLTRDNSSRISLEGRALDDITVLAGTTAVATFDSNSRALLSLSASAPSARGTVTAFNEEELTMTLGGRRTLDFNIDENATIRRDGEPAEIADITVGDTGEVVFVKKSANRRVVLVVLEAADKKK